VSSPEGTPFLTYHDPVQSAVIEQDRAELPAERIRRQWGAISVPFWIGVSRIVLGVVFAHLVVVLLPQARQHLTGGTLAGGSWLGAFDRWDSAYYTGLAQHAYPVDQASHAAFFPGYPLLIAIVHGVSLGTLSYFHAALVISWISLTAASVVLYRLATRLFSERVALIATVLFCWFPASLFFLSAYSEAFFALLILIVITLLVQERFLAAALVAAFASATSPESVALTIALMVTAVMAGKGIARVVAYGAISGLGLLGFMLYLWDQFGHPFEFISVQKDWMRSEHFPFVGLYRNILALRHYVTGPGSPRPGATSPTFTNIKWVWLLDDACLVVAAVLAVTLIVLYVQRRGAAEGSESSAIPISLVVVTFIVVLLATCTTISPYALPTYASSEGQERFVSIAVPLFVAGALVIRRRPSLVAFAVGGSVIVALVFQAMYNLGYWVT
jgi:hypothetical protein